MGSYARSLPSGVITADVNYIGTAPTTVNSYSIESSTPLSAIISSSTNVSCNGGSNGLATVTASGGSSPYTYSWSPSGGTGSTASGLSAGTYTVTVTDATSALKTVTVAITQPVSPSSRVVTNVSCFGGSNGTVNLTPSGGTSPYTF